jgi:polysaccharide export outer membrane protein
MGAFTEIGSSLKIGAVGLAVLIAAGVQPALPGGRLLTAMDVLSIRIPEQPDLDATTRIEPDGTINLAYVGRIKAAGLTEDALARVIEKRLIELQILARP